MAINPVVKDVDVNASNKRRCRRYPGEIPYPIAYSNKMADFDIWDHMFLASYFKSLTMHQFSIPPSVVLDLGCGTGYWVIEAAKKWKDSKVYGFDAAKIQPRLEEMEHYKPLAQRIEWVHGNFLDGLPFSSNCFDFVRIAGLGLAIPEDEWQAVLEEVHRVMKPGAVLEIIEDDLLFPCSSALLQNASSRKSSSSSNSTLQSFDLHKSKSTMFYDRSTTSPGRPSLAPSSFHETQFIPQTPMSTLLPSFSWQSESDTSTLVPSSCSTETTSDTEHPQDHTRLKEAWEAMLSTRFLSSNLLSVLPFYLNSSFVNTKSHAPLLVPLPPNSGNVPTLKTYRSMGTLRNSGSERSIGDTLLNFEATFSFRSIKTDGVSFRSSVSSMQKQSVSAWATMHLAKTVSIVRGCKEAIWNEYKKLYSRDAPYLLSRTAPDDEDYLSQPHRYVVRRAFEVDWKNWEFDMIDRTNMANNLLTHVGWVHTIPDSERDRPDWRTWRGKLDRKSGSDTSGHLITAYNPTDSCRSLRVFTGFKG
ncbi:hypothetical protein GALMADRAFT_244511 [Galerina marginata CBS 339.88]|uniref:Methyltransferase domain-containing protein n=1 Tax=Galerina marginata (strain CBS 339.88) TaxID=685588 RepID=A0A067T941_GALM3|nr:hypothetical protein GALMADRAFT_244511 [Galerina marginata CBS 339.88]